MLFKRRPSVPLRSPSALWLLTDGKCNSTHGAVPNGSGPKRERILGKNAEPLVEALPVDALPCGWRNSLERRERRDGSVAARSWMTATTKALQLADSME